MADSNMIGRRIKQLRDGRNETQADLAKAMLVKRETVNMWESGTRDLKTQYTVSLAKHFETTCDFILRGVEAENISVHEKTGLSEKAIQNLINLKGNAHHYRFNQTQALNSLLEYIHIPGLLHKIMQFIEVVEDAGKLNDLLINDLSVGAKTKEIESLEKKLSENSGISENLLGMVPAEEILLFNLQQEFITMIRDIASYNW